MWYFNSVMVYEADAWLTDGKTYAQYICKVTGLATAAGFGSKKGNGFDTKFA
jgi:hypothetical protein